MTMLTLDQQLPLTCTRSGTCCHGKDIRITPWELAVLARARNLAARVFRDRYTTAAGTALSCNGAPGWRGLPACGQYDPQYGCTVHAARPLACRLYPLGRERRGDTVNYFHEGNRFPCLDGCPEVAALPKISVREYLAGQHIELSAAARDAYLELAQDLAEGAFVLVFDGGLAASGAVDWRSAWQSLVVGEFKLWHSVMPSTWYDVLTIPEHAASLDDVGLWIKVHAEVLQHTAQQTWAAEREPTRLCAGSTAMLAAALLVLFGVGADANDIGTRWLRRAEAG